jgi:hypothetical protein
VNSVFLIRIVGVGGGVELSPLGTSATEWPILPAPGDMMMENLVEWRLAGETEVLGENLPHRNFVHHKSHLPDPGPNPCRRGGKPATNRLSYGAAFVNSVNICLLASLTTFFWSA